MNADMWAKAEFESLELGDVRRTRRLITIVARMAERPAGTVTGVFEDPAEREGAYRLLSNEDVELSAVRFGIEDATVRRCAGEDFVFVAEDGSSLAITDDAHLKGTGPVGSHDRGARGLQVVTAIALREDGVPQGVCGQIFWARAEQSHARKSGRRPMEERETTHWAGVIDHVTDAFSRGADPVRPWFVMDRGADCWELLRPLYEADVWFTVRSSHNRRLVTGRGKPPAYLRDTPSIPDFEGWQDVLVPARAGRPARTAHMHIQVRRVDILLQSSRGKPRGNMPLWLVHTVEETPPVGVTPLEWRLLTNRPVPDLAAARLVLHGYVLRWRIEEFHRAWKTGSEETEDTQLRSAGAMKLWATLHAVCAMRLLRMMYLARHAPELPAAEEFSPEEVEASFLAMSRRPPQTPPTLGQVVMLIALAGGYTGKSSGGPPGLQILARGWRRVLPVAKVLVFQREGLGCREM